MRKTDLIQTVAKAANLSSREADDAVSSLFEQITNALARNESISLVGFGSFTPKKRAARTGKNPQTGETLHIPEKRQVQFKPSAKLRALVDQ
ncbi:HU family DNA-binding protein [Teredinibacter franksiae]|jgi:Bacterial nucleoid DNA-binding protein|uniref:HU family DNA-binding protein n=1 Tax=Teredinibacter franksiae TaxID=2761453 RepID=UPI001623CB7C|nr:HU family DNA-binding protein [Teredinibacter franksiae]